MPHLRFLDSARDNLVEVAGYITAAGGEDAAVRFTGEIIEKCEHLATLTGLPGRARPELRADIRSTPFKNYLIFFRYLPSEPTATFSRSSTWSKATATSSPTSVTTTERIPAAEAARRLAPACRHSKVNHEHYEPPAIPSRTTMPTASAHDSSCPRLSRASTT